MGSAEVRGSADGSDATGSDSSVASRFAAWSALNLAARAYSGGSSRKVYSRTRRPFAQFNSTSTSLNGKFDRHQCRIQVYVGLAEDLPRREPRTQRVAFTFLQRNDLDFRPERLPKHGENRQLAQARCPSERGQNQARDCWQTNF